MTDHADPACDKCGAPITTGLIAAICPHREQCAYWPDDLESQQFLDSLGWRFDGTFNKAVVGARG